MTPTPCLLLFPNRGDAATLAGGAWQIPLANVQDRIIQRVARTADVDPISTQMEISLDRSRATRAVVLVNSTASLAGRKRVRLFSASGERLAQTGTEDSDGWEDVFPRERPTSQMRWSDTNFWSGKPTLEDLKGQTLSTITLFDTEHFARRITIEFDDRANSTRYLNFGRLFVAGQYQPSHNYGFGAALSFDVRTTVSRSRGGTVYPNRRRHPRLKTISFQNLPKAEAMAQVFEIQRRAGIDQELFYVEDPSDLINRQRTSFLARQRSLPAIVESALGRCDVSFDIEEII